MKNDAIVDQTFFLSSTDNTYYIDGIPKNIKQLVGKPDIGRMPEADNEIVIAGNKKEYYIGTKYEELMSKVIEKINSDTEFLIDFEINKLDSMHDNEELVKIADEISLKNKRMGELENLKKEILHDLKKDLITNDDYDFYFETYNNEMKKLLKELNILMSLEMSTGVLENCK